MYRLSLLLVLSFALRGFSPGTPVFPFPHKPTFPNYNSIWNAQISLYEFLLAYNYCYKGFIAGQKGKITFYLSPCWKSISMLIWHCQIWNRLPILFKQRSPYNQICFSAVLVSNCVIFLTYFNIAKRDHVYSLRRLYRYPVFKLQCAAASPVKYLPQLQRRGTLFVDHGPFDQGLKGSDTRTSLVLDSVWVLQDTKEWT